MVHNSLFGGAIKAKCDESRQLFESLKNSETMLFDDTEELHMLLENMRMVVDENMDESNLANYYFMERQQYELFIIVMVTRQCNFRCVYYYENFVDVRMDDTTYNDLLTAIEHLIDTKGYKILRVSFFGGEPMLEYDSMCKFSEKAGELADRKEIFYRAGITTNGYLLTKEKLEKLSGLRVHDFMITVDGLKETHDKSRFLVNGKGTWDIIMKNLPDARDSKCDYSMTIRTNFGEEIQHTQDEFLRFLSQNFKDDENLDIVEDEAGVVSEMLITAKRMGLNIEGSLFFANPFSLVCYAAKNDSFTIDCDGKIMKCTVHLDIPENHIGGISEGKFQVKDHLAAMWTSGDLREKCKSCKILPVCYNKKCPAIIMPDEACEMYISNYENALKALYLM